MVGTQFLLVLASMAFSLFSILAILIGVEWDLMAVLIWISKGEETSFHVIICHLYIFFGELYFTHFLIGLFVFSLLSLESS